MSKDSRIDVICIIIASITLIITILFMFGESLGLKTMSRTMKYESTLFDDSYVHKIDIVMNDWDSFIESCEDEEYSPCTVVVDGKKHSNVAIRAKGNTSLSSVRSMGSQRYSFKLEFDHYDDSKSLDGLDKLCLNNLIQDNTMMKDYLAYRLMGDFGVDSPLCSFVYLTVNGEDWGLYLAVEGVEDGFLARNYGSDIGDLYKPDSLSFGGGRGNGKGFNMDDFDFGDFDWNSFDVSSFSSNSRSESSRTRSSSSRNSNEQGGNVPTDMSGFMQGGNVPNMGGNMPSNMPTEMSGFMQGGNVPNMGGNMPSNMPTDMSGFMQGGNVPNMGGNMPSDMPADMSGFMHGGNVPSSMESFEFSSFSGMDGGFGGGFGGFGGMGSNDVKLKYTDDDPDSYSNIFDNAKTDVSNADKKRLIESLKKLGSYTDLENVVDMDEVLRYFVVHNFVCNGDSYTGSMIHNYYLYEKDGQLSMIPWDYNLAFGTFSGGNASSSVNASIDNPVSGGSVDDRPMVGWIFSDEKYTEEYHRLFASFIEEWFSDGQLEKLISDTAEMIRPYVEKDPTKFCSVEEFDKGLSAMTSFVTLRAEAVKRQLNGDSTRVETGSVNLSDMGSMGSTGFGRSESRLSSEDRGSLNMNRMGGMNSFSMPTGFDRSMPDGASFDRSSFDARGPSSGNQSRRSGNNRTEAYILLGVSLLALFAGLLIAKKRK